MAIQGIRGAILKLRFPTFSYGGYTQKQEVCGKVVDLRISIECDGIQINFTQYGVM